MAAASAPPSALLRGRLTRAPDKGGGKTKGWGEGVDGSEEEGIKGSLHLQEKEWRN